MVYIHADFIRFLSEMQNDKVENITEDDIVDFLKTSIAKYNLTHKAYSNLETLIIGIFKYAKKKKYTSLSISHIIGDMEISKKTFNRVIKDKCSQVYTEDEIPIMVQYLKKHEDLINLGILLVFETGIRCGELVSLKREDFSSNTKTLQIRRTEIKYKFEDGITRRTVRDFPKTENSIRDIILTETAVKILKKLIKLNPFGEFLVENLKTHNRVSESTFYRRIENICKQLGFQCKSMHKIRKTYGTTLIDAKVDESLIMEQMGHSDIATTKKYYYYFNKGKENKEKQINDAFNF